MFYFYLLECWRHWSRQRLIPLRPVCQRVCVFVWRCMQEETRRGKERRGGDLILCLTGFLMPTMCPQQMMHSKLNALVASRVFGCSTLCHAAASFVSVFLALSFIICSSFSLRISLVFYAVCAAIFSTWFTIYLFYCDVMFHLNWYIYILFGVLLPRLSLHRIYTY